MCFSATASFTTAFLLSLSGALSVYKFRQPTQLYFAAIPLLFAFQQASEGMVWLSFLSTKYIFLRSFGTYTFLFFAFIIWPIWIPLALYKLEKRVIRKKILSFLLGCGFAISFGLLYLLHFGATATLTNNHIWYQTHVDKLEYTALLYFIPILVPFFISSVYGMWFFGICVFFSYMLTRYFWNTFSTSVWCFFAAILSGLVIVILQFWQDHYSSRHILKRHAP